MAKINRYEQKIFGSTATAGKIAKIGSLAAGAPVFTSDPSVLQSLSNYLQGLEGILMGSNSPALEDFNALFFLITHQLSYIMQTGVPEWNAQTTYFIGSVCNDGYGNQYISKTNNNLNNPLTSSANWTLSSGVTETINSAASPRALTSQDNNKVFIVDNSTGGVQFTLPAMTNIQNMKITFKDVNGVCSIPANNMSLVPDGTDKIEQVNGSFLMDSDFGVWTFIINGTNAAIV